MLIGRRLQTLRTAKGISQGEMEKRTGLLRCYISRVENGHTVPAIETLEKMARALEVPMYFLFYDVEAARRPPDIPAPPRRTDNQDWGSSRKDAHYLKNLFGLLGQVTKRDRNLLLSITQKMVASRRDHNLGSSAQPLPPITSRGRAQDKTDQPESVAL